MSMMYIMTSVTTDVGTGRKKHIFLWSAFMDINYVMFTKNTYIHFFGGICIYTLKHSVRCQGFPSDYRGFVCIATAGSVEATTALAPVGETEAGPV